MILHYVRQVNQNVKLTMYQSLLIKTNVVLNITVVSCFLFNLKNPFGLVYTSCSIKEVSLKTDCSGFCEVMKLNFFTVCRPETCPKPPACNNNEQVVRVNSQTDCCGMYHCKRKYENNYF